MIAISNHFQFVEYPSLVSDYGETAEIVAKTALQLGELSMRFAHIERIPRYDGGRRENDAEHSFMLALVAPEIATALELPLNVPLVHQYATVHDLIELRTGDVNTFGMTKEEVAAKADVEHSALPSLLADLPPYTRMLVADYEKQDRPESRFVRAVDKLLPMVVDIIGDGTRVVTEDHGISNLQELQKNHDVQIARVTSQFGVEFPVIALAHKLLREMFEQQVEFAPATS